MRGPKQAAALVTMFVLAAAWAMPTYAQTGNMPKDQPGAQASDQASNQVSDRVSDGPSVARPYGDCRAGYWRSNRNLDDSRNVSQATCLLQWRPKLTKAVRAGLSARAVAQHLQEPASNNGAPSNNRVREAWLEADWGAWTVRAGRQHIVWGRADRISPTDVLSPRDYTALTADDEEQRNGIDALQIKFQINPAVSTTAIVSRFEGHVLPQGLLPASLLPGQTRQRTEWALRIDRTGSGWDGALSYFDGLDRQPRYWSVLSGAGVSFDRVHERQRMLGLDFATSSGRWTMRAEAALIKASPDCDLCPLRSRDLRRWVVGADRDFGDSANFNVQLFGVQRSGYIAPDAQAASLLAVNQGLDRLNSEYGERETGVTLRWSNRMLNDRLRLDLAAIKEFTHGSWVARPRISWAVNDSMTLRAGVDHFQGDPQSYFGARKKNNVLFAEASLLF